MATAKSDVVKTSLRNIIARNQRDCPMSLREDLESFLKTTLAFNSISFAPLLALVQARFPNDKEEAGQILVKLVSIALEQVSTGQAMEGLSVESTSDLLLTWPQNLVTLKRKTVVDAVKAFLKEDSDGIVALDRVLSFLETTFPTDYTKAKEHLIAEFRANKSAFRLNMDDLLVELRV